jgi:hypothetical protein
MLVTLVELAYFSVLLNFAVPLTTGRAYFDTQVMLHYITIFVLYSVSVCAFNL